MYDFGNCNVVFVRQSESNLVVKSIFYGVEDMSRRRII